MKVSSADSFDMSEYDSLMMLESKAFSSGTAATEDKDLDISFAGLKNSSTSFLRFTQIKDGNTISGKALAFLRCTMLLRPSLPRTFNMLSEIAGKSKSMEDKKAGDEAMRWAERHTSNHGNCEASRSPIQSITQGHAPNNIEVLAVLQVTDVKSSIFVSCHVTAMVVSAAAVNNGCPECPQRMDKEVLVLNGHKNHTLEGLVFFGRCWMCGWLQRVVP